MDHLKHLNGKTWAAYLWILGSTVVVTLASTMGLHAALPDHAPAAAHAEIPAQYRSFFKNYCVECHGAEKQKGKLRLDDLSLAIDSVEKAEKWAKILNSINSGDMPPDDAKQPEKAAKADFLETLSQTMVVARKALTDQRGKITMRRLNRREYQNTLGELLGVEIDVATLPMDGSSDTFDTIGSALFMSPDQFQLYRQLARKALDQSFTAAMAKPELRKLHNEAEAETLPAIEKQLAEFVSIRKRYTKWTSQVDAAARLPENQEVVSALREKAPTSPEKVYLGWDKIKGAPSPKDFGFPDAVDANMMNGRWDSYVPQGIAYLTLPKAKTGSYLGVAHLHHRWVHVRIPSDWPPGNYKVRARLAATDEGPVERRFVDFLASYPSGHVLSTHQVTGTMENPQLLEIPLKLDKDSQRQFKFAEKAVLGNADGMGPAGALFSAGYKETRIGPEFAVWVDWVEAEGPFPPAEVTQVLAGIRSQIERFEKKECGARQFLAEFTEKALRGRHADAEFLDKLTRLYEIRIKAGDKPLEALKEPLSLTLASPSFLYLAEPADEAKPRQLLDLELATRLSFFLWSAPPDEKLIQLARKGDLKKDGVLAQQVERLLADPRSDRFTRSFVSQWLGLSRLDFFQFSARLYPSFDLPTKAASKEEVFQTFSRLLKKRDSLAKLLKSDSIFINGLLAQYYQIPDVQGDEFREVLLPVGSPRGGLLGMAAILSMGSNGEQTSPVERGAWVLRKLMHDPPPPAPANVPQLNRLAGKPLTTRERIALHQEEPQCAQCHRKIDPIGFGLENFNAVGKWRTEDLRPDVPPKNNGIDASGVFHKGAAFKDYFELRDFIAAKPEPFARGFTEALIEYGLGRGFGFSDEELANQIVAQAAQKNFSVPEFIQALVASKSFQSK